MTEWYFAYGANMATRVLERRSVVARESHAAWLPGYALGFEEPGPRWIEPAFASVREDAEGTVHGVLHRLGEEGMAQLDRFEGVGYDRVHARIECEAVGAVEACFYLPRLRATDRRPSRRYVGLLVEGAREHALPADWIAWLEAHPTYHVPVLSHLGPVFMRTAEQMIMKSRRFEVWFRRRGDRAR